MSTFSFYEETYDDLAIKAKSKMWNKSYNYLLTKVVDFCDFREGQKVLDIGCGSASIVDKLPNNVFYCGVDISKSVINTASKRFQNNNKATFRCLNAADLSVFEDGLFDVVISVEMMEHLTFCEWLGVLDEMRRVCKSGGKIVLSMPNLYYLWAYIPYSFFPVKSRLAFKGLVKGLLDGVNYETYHTSEGIEAPFHRRISPFRLKVILEMYFEVDKVETTYWYNNRPIHNLFEKFQSKVLDFSYKYSGLLGSQVIVRCLNQ